MSTMYTRHFMGLFLRLESKTEWIVSMTVLMEDKSPIGLPHLRMTLPMPTLLMSSRRQSGMKARSINLNLNLNLHHLYSAPHEPCEGFQVRFTLLAAQANHLTVSHQYEKEPPSPRSTPWGAYRSASLMCHRSSFSQAFSACHSHTHSHMVIVDRSMVVGHVLTVHTCSFMCTNHIDMIAHTPAFFTSWGALPSSRLPSCKQRIAGFFFFFFLK